MGIYYTTFLNLGKFTTAASANIRKRMAISNLDPIIEGFEWNRGYVARSDLYRTAQKSPLREEFTKFVDSRKPNEDLFLSEETICTLESPISSIDVKYILVNDEK